MDKQNIVIGSRKSKLALAQSELVKELIHLRTQIPLKNIIIKPIITTGDKILDRNLSEIGGKGLFTQEIEEQLFQGEIDLAVHSMKDMPIEFPDNLEIAAILTREDPRDVLLGAENLEAVKRGGIFGTSSTRRKHLVKALRPDLEIIPFRGNVLTRLDKLRDNVADATCLALAGLKRLNLDREIDFHILDPQIFTPAISQGAIGVEVNNNNKQALEIAKIINHQHSYEEIALEREFLKYLDGSCKTPIGGLCVINGEQVEMNVMVANQQTGSLYREVINENKDRVKDKIIEIAMRMKRFL